MVAVIGMIARRLLAACVLGDAAGAESAGLRARSPSEIRPDRARAGVPDAARVLLRLRGADRRRGDQQRRARLPQAQEQERRHHAAAHGLVAITMFGGIIALARHRRARGRGPGDLRLATACRSGRLRPARPIIAQVADAVFGGRPGVLLHLGRHRADPVPRRQHRLQRLPGARLDPGPGPLPAPPAAHPRRPARLLQRHRHPGRGRGRCSSGVRRRRHPPDPALHRRRVRLVHAEPDRHGPALDPPPEDRDRPEDPRADAPLAGDQRLRRDHDRAGAGRRAGHQVHARRLDRVRRDGRCSSS